jgi:hypothetical protein
MKRFTKNATILVMIVSHLTIFQIGYLFQAMQAPSVIVLDTNDNIYPATHDGTTASTADAFISSVKGSVTNHKSKNEDPNAGAGTDRPNSKFDDIRQILYKEAIKPVGSSASRSKFSLEGWNRGSGGLDDADRVTLGDLYLNAQSVFEYGLGESTLIAAHTGVPRYSGIDSDAMWVSQARENSKLEHFRFNFADIGTSKAWGRPQNPLLQKIQYNYQIAPLVVEDESFDVYLVDGRYRVACACVSFLHAIKTGGNMDTVRVGVHDNDGNHVARRHHDVRNYDVLTTVADVMIKNSKLWTYKLKNDTTEEDLYNLWDASRSKISR